MTEMMAGGRMRPTAVLTVLGLLAAVVALCCCVGEARAGHEDPPHSTALVTALIAVHSDTTDGAAAETDAHLGDCAPSGTGVVAGSAPSRDALRGATSGAEWQPGSGPDFSGAVPVALTRPPALHLLCVMRT